MAVVTTGSTVQGLVQGLKHGVVGNVASNTDGQSEIIVITGNPDAVVTGLGSSVAYDSANGEYYMNLIQNGSTWIHLVSGP